MNTKLAQNSSYFQLQPTDMMKSTLLLQWLCSNNGDVLQAMIDNLLHESWSWLTTMSSNERQYCGSHPWMWHFWIARLDNTLDLIWAVQHISGCSCSQGSAEECHPWTSSVLLKLPAQIEVGRQTRTFKLHCSARRINQHSRGSCAATSPGYVSTVGLYSS